MALTELEKGVLSMAIRDFFKAKAKEDFSCNQQEILDFIYQTDYCHLPKNINTVSLNAGIRRNLYRFDLKEVDFYNNKNKTYSFRKDKRVYIYGSADLKKNKNILAIEASARHIDNNSLTIHYDFNTGEWDIPADDIVFNTSDSDTDILETLKHEWIWNYVIHIYDGVGVYKTTKKYFGSAEKMPSGLYDCMTNKDRLTAMDVIRCYLKHNLPGGEKYLTFYESLITENVSVEEIERVFKDITLPQLLQMTKFDILNGSFLGVRYDHLYRKFFDLYTKLPEVYDISYQIDTNRGVAHNVDNMESLINKEKNKALGKILQRLNFINNYEIDDYVVVVPQSQEDKIEEGRQQHNCVGDYYDKSILEGQNYIYFLRRKSNPKKSYITCRYNNNVEDTVEYKYKNNEPVFDDKECDIIEQISTLIRKHFAEQAV